MRLRIEFVPCSLEPRDHALSVRLSPSARQLLGVVVAGILERRDALTHVIGVQTQPAFDLDAMPPAS